MHEQAKWFHLKFNDFIKQSLKVLVFKILIIPNYENMLEMNFLLETLN